MLLEVVKVGAHSLTLYVDFDGEVSAKVDGQYSFQNLPPRVGAVLIRKGRKAFEEYAKSTSQELWCSAYNADLLGGHRERVFKWAGFVPDPECEWKLVYNG